MSLKGDLYDDKRCLDTILGYLHPKYKAVFKEEARRLQNQKTGFPFYLTMTILGATFLQWAKQHDLDNPGKGIKQVNKIYDDNDVTEDSDGEVYAVYNSKIKCPDCGLANHTDDDCNIKNTKSVTTLDWRSAFSQSIHPSCIRGALLEARVQDLAGSHIIMSRVSRRLMTKMMSIQ